MVYMIGLLVAAVVAAAVMAILLKVDIAQPQATPEFVRVPVTIEIPKTRTLR
jgi:hypothetical protein